MAAQPHRTRLFVLRMPRARWEFVAVAHLHGWSYVGERPAGAGNPHVIIMEVLPGITVWYWEFDDPRLCAVTVDSTLGPESIEPFATLVQATLVPFTLTELVEEIDNASDRVLGLWRAGFGAPDQVDPVFLSRFSAAAAAPDPAVRTAAIMAMTQTGWPQCGPVIEEIARTDSKRAVRQVARRAIQALPAMRQEGRPVPVSVPDLYPGHARDLYPIAMRKLAAVIDSLRQNA